MPNLSEFVGWDSPENTVLRWELVEGETWDARAVAYSMYDVLENLGGRVDLIINLSEPKSAHLHGIVARFIDEARYLPDNVTLIVVTGGSEFGSRLVEAFTHAYRQTGKNWLIAESLDDARNLILVDREQAGAP
jgi:hypothetical protein